MSVLADLHALFGGLVLGLVAWFLARRQGVRGWRAWFWCVAAKYASTALLFLAGILFSHWVPEMLGASPMSALRLAFAAFLLLLWLLPAFAEWPFLTRGLGLGLGLSLRASLICALLLVAAYLPSCELSFLVAKGASSALPEGVQVCFLRGGAVLQKGRGGEGLLRRPVAFGADARPFARREADGWTLGIRDAEAEHCLVPAVFPASARCALQPLCFVRRGSGTVAREPLISECWGQPARLEELPSAWRVRLDARPGEGVLIASRDLGGFRRLALDTPILSWSPGCGTLLPGDQLLFQMGPWIWRLELADGRLEPFAKGQGPLVFAEGKTQPH